MRGETRDINKLLDIEHLALLSGDYAALSEISEIKEELLTDEKTFAGIESSPEIRRKLDRNQTLIAMAISGIRSARSQLETIEGQRQGFDAYDKHGGRNPIGRMGPDFETKI